MALNIRFKGKTKVNERGECVDYLICSEEFPDCFERGGGGGVTPGCLARAMRCMSRRAHRFGR